MDRQADFRGGLNTAVEPDLLAENEIQRADEAVLDQYGAIKKRFGSRRLSNTPMGADGVQQGYAWLKDDGSQEIMVVADGDLYTAAFGTPTTFTQVGTGLATTGTPAMVSFRDSVQEVCYIADGTGTASLAKWDGSTLTPNLSSTPPGLTQLAIYNQRLFGCTGTDQKVWWSTLNNGDTLGQAGAGGGEAIVRTFGDQNITGLAVQGASLLIFHTSGISRFTGFTQDDQAIAAGAQGLTGDVGAITGRSIVSTPEGVFFLSDRGFYVATEENVAPISLKLDPTFRALNLTQSEGAVGVHRRALREVWWYIPDVGIYRYNYALGAWTGPMTGGYTGIPTTALWEAEDVEGQPVVLAGDEDGYVLLTDAPGIFRDSAAHDGTGGTVFTFAVRTKRFLFGDPVMTKAFKWVYLLMATRGSRSCSMTWLTETASGVIGIRTIGDDGTGAGEWGTGTWGTGTWGAGGQKAIRIPVNGTGRYLEIIMADSGEAQSIWQRAEVAGFDYGRRYQ